MPQSVFSQAEIFLESDCQLQEMIGLFQENPIYTRTWFELQWGGILLGGIFGGCSF